MNDTTKPEEMYIVVKKNGNHSCIFLYLKWAQDCMERYNKEEPEWNQAKVYRLVEISDN